MQVWKFGGTSVGSPERMFGVAELICADDQRKLVVLSAVSGETNALVELNELIRQGNMRVFASQLHQMRQRYEVFIAGLYKSKEYLLQASDFIANRMRLIERCGSAERPADADKRILAQGELISTQLFHWLLEERGQPSVLLPALDFMRIDRAQEPDEYYIKSMLSKEMEDAASPIYITQGYICRNADGAVDNLKRGGSDYTATILGQAVEAEAIQIWTDIDGLHNNDPRVVDKTFPIQHLSYDEAAELAYFGAKILHPSCVLPAQRADIPIYLKNTMDPSSPGTIISSLHGTADLTAIAAKDNITAIKIKSGRMLMAYGFLKKVFEIFERYETPIDMITTSEVAVSLTIDNDARLPKILEELKRYGQIEVDRDQTIVCIVGSFTVHRSGYASRIFAALKDIPIRMISFGGSKYNVSILVNSAYKKDALVALNEGLFPVAVS